MVIIIIIIIGSSSSLKSHFLTCSIFMGIGFSIFLSVDPHVFFRLDCNSHTNFEMRVAFILNARSVHVLSNP
jgi:hypothetical protein